MREEAREVCVRGAGGGEYRGAMCWEAPLRPELGRLTVPIAELNRLQAEVLDDILAGAGRAAPVVVQARHLHCVCARVCE